MEIIIIVACTKNKVIGANGKIPWNIPEERQHFKETTIGNAIIFGRKTFDGIGKALPNRFNVVVSASRSSSQEKNVHFANSLKNAILLCKKSGFSKVFICGGEQIYREALNERICSKIILSEINENVCENVIGADAFFPEISEKDWILQESVPHKDFTIYIYNAR